MMKKKSISKTLCVYCRKPGRWILGKVYVLGQDGTNQVDSYFFVSI